jgi:prevent-host-death family protein
MKTVTTRRFKTKCLEIMEEVSATGEPVMITKKGKRVAKLVHADAKSDDVFGCLSGVMKIVGDITKPVAEVDDWEALR